MENYTFSSTGSELMTFIRDEFADFVIEAYKLEKDRSKYGKEVISYVLVTLLKLAHPYIPFITEALYGEITGGKSLIESPWPKNTWKRNESIEGEMNHLFELVRTIRNLRAESKIKPGEKKDVYLSGVIPAIVMENESLIAGLTKTEALILSKKPEQTGSFAYGISYGIEVYVDAAIDAAKIEEEKARLEAEIEDKKSYLRTISMKLMNPSFASNAPEKVVRAEMEKQKSLEEQLQKLEEKYRGLIGL